MPSCLPNQAKLLYAKTLHDLAAPLGALTLCVDDLKKALPDSAGMIETSIETLAQRISYWRLMVTGPEHSPSHSEAANVIRPLAKLKGIEVTFVHAQEYQGAYVRLILAVTMVCLESLPRGGKIIIDADKGSVSASGEKCYLPSEFKAVIARDVLNPSTQHALGVLIADLAKSCGVGLNINHVPTNLTFNMETSSQG